MQRESDRRIKLLGDALGKVLAKIGVIRDDVPLTGPELLNAAEAYTAGTAGDSDAPDAR